MSNKHSNTIHNLKNTIIETRKELKFNLQLNVKLRNKLSLYEISDNLKTSKTINIRKKKRTSTNAEQGTIITLLSDIHAEHKIQYAQTNGLNKLTPEITKHRLHNYFNNFLTLTRLTRNGIVLDNLIIGLLGDNIHGFIHEEYLRTNYMTPIEASMFITDILQDGIQLILEDGEFKNITMICKVGNHSRTTNKVYTDEEAKHSYEWGIYHILAQHFPTIKWVIDESYFTYMKVYDKVLRFHHGHGFRYQGGVGGIYVPWMRYIYKINKQKPANMDFIGHWHTREFLASGGGIINGSVCGVDPYSIRMGFPAEPPTQTFQILDAKRGFTINAPIMLE